VSFPSGYAVQTPNLRTRTLEEWGCFLVFTPEDPDIHWLNTPSWVTFQLCDGRSVEEIENIYLTLAGPGKPERLLRRQLRESLELLESKGIVRILEEPPQASVPS
jgi:hypothetical protein